MLEETPEELLGKLKAFLKETGLSTDLYRLDILKILPRKNAVELFLITPEQLRCAITCQEAGMNLVFTGLQVGWFERNKKGETGRFKPSLAFIDTLENENLPVIHISTKDGQKFLHGQDIAGVKPVKSENTVEAGSTCLVYSEGCLVGLGKLEKTGDLTNLIDKGRYIRIERKKHGRRT